MTLLNQIKVLIIDDSHVIHIILEKIISVHDDITIIGDAYDGKEGVEKVIELSPDVIIMDIGMPLMDGLQAIEEIMNVKPTPIIVFSGSSKKIVNLGFKAIELGAVDMVEKPASLDISVLKNYIEDKLIKSIRTFSDFKVMRRIKNKRPSPLNNNQPVNLNITGKNYIDRKITTANRIEPPSVSSDEIIHNFPIIGIAASTGGPQTLRALLEDYSKRKINAAVIIVQHMAEGFMEGFCEWLALYSSLPVVLPKNGDEIKPNTVYIAPGEHHLVFDKQGRFSFLDSPPIQGIRPSADIMLNSLGEIYQDRVIAIILTGMGSDGTQGLFKIKEKKGYIISQDEESSLIFGMPKSAIESGLVDKVLNISDISEHLEKYCAKKYMIH